MLRSVVWFCFFCIGFQSIAQIDSSSYQHSRKKAALMSVVLPGTGQFYNEFGHRKIGERKNISWWRAPIYLSGLAFTGYYARANALEAARFKKEWLKRDELGISFYDFTLKDSTLSSIESGFTKAAEYRDYLIVGFFAVYALNVLDAYVDAHFVSFNVSDDLSLDFEPKIFAPNSLGLSMVFKFK